MQHDKSSGLAIGIATMHAVTPTNTLLQQGGRKRFPSLSRPLSSMHCRPILDEVAGASFELSEAQYAANEREDTWVQKLLSLLVRFAMWMQPLTTVQVFNSIFGFLIDRVSRCPSAS